VMASAIVLIGFAPFVRAAMAVASAGSDSACSVPSTRTLRRGETRTKQGAALRIRGDRPVSLWPWQIFERRVHAGIQHFRHLNARASALTMALSTRGRGAHGAPSGVTTLRPPRFVNVIGMCTVGRLAIRRVRCPPCVDLLLPAMSPRSPVSPPQGSFKVPASKPTPTGALGNWL
jgi:hypothetical protein